MKGRLAPSPTGLLHIGHARTFLLAWLGSRSLGGKMVLRIEDIDGSRVRKGMADRAVEDLSWLGLDWDEGPDVGGPFGPYTQSQRSELYQSKLEELKRRELVYPCTCTRADIERAASAPHASDEPLSYPGTCAHRSASDADSLGKSGFAWRFRSPDGLVSWTDGVLGETSIDLQKSGGDFVVWRNGVGPAYQLAVVCDDAAMEIAQVVRGDDLVSSTPRQIVLYRALGYTIPEFYHVPLVYGVDGRRLAKRDGSTAIASLREQGVAATVLVGVLAQSCGLTELRVPSTPADWIEAFSWDALPRPPWSFDSGDSNQ